MDWFLIVMAIPMILLAYGVFVMPYLVALKEIRRDIIRLDIEKLRLMSENGQQSEDTQEKTLKNGGYR